MDTKVAAKARMSKERLTKYLRLTVYNFLTVEETLFGPALLSTNERKDLKESHIAREGKMLKFYWLGSHFENCILHGSRLELLKQRLSTTLLLTDRIEIMTRKKSVIQNHT